MPVHLLIVVGGLVSGWVILLLLGAERQRRLEALRGDWERSIVSSGNKQTQ